MCDCSPLTLCPEAQRLLERAYSPATPEEKRSRYIDYFAHRSRFRRMYAKALAILADPNPPLVQ